MNRKTMSWVLGLSLITQAIATSAQAEIVITRPCSSRYLEEVETSGNLALAIALGGGGFALSRLNNGAAFAASLGVLGFGTERVMEIAGSIPVSSQRDQSWVKGLRVSQFALAINPDDLKYDSAIPARPVSDVAREITDPKDPRRIIVDLVKGDSMLEAQPFRDVVRAVREMNENGEYCENKRGATLEQIREKLHAKVLREPDKFRGETLGKLADQLTLTRIELDFQIRELKRELDKIQRQNEDENRNILKRRIELEKLNRQSKALEVRFDKDAEEQISMGLVSTGSGQVHAK